MKMIKIKHLIHTSVYIAISIFLASCSGGESANSGKLCSGDILIPFQEKKEKDWGFLNINGEVIISPEFDYEPSVAVNGIARIKEKNRDGKTYYRYIKIKDGKAIESKKKYST